MIVYFRDYTSSDPDMNSRVNQEQSTPANVMLEEPVYRFSGSLLSISPRLLYRLPCQCLFFFSKSLDQLFILFTVNVCIILIVCITLYVCLYIYYIKVFLAKTKNWIKKKKGQDVQWGNACKFSLLRFHRLNLFQRKG